MIDRAGRLCCVSTGSAAAGPRVCVCRYYAGMGPFLLTIDTSRVLRVVLDTNAVMALWHFLDPALAGLRRYVETDAVALLSSDACLGELQRVLAYRQFAIAPQRQQALYAAYAARVNCVPEADAAEQAALASLPRCKDRDDQKFISLAWQAQADVLVTRDKLLLKLARKAPLRERLAILTPERLQLALQATAQEAGEGAVST